jgi:hypothetical protein
MVLVQVKVTNNKYVEHVHRPSYKWLDDYEELGDKEFVHEIH